MNLNNVNEYIQIIMALFMPIAFIGVLVHRAITRNEKGNRLGLGLRSIQFLGVALIFPTILILALNQQLEHATLGTLLGTVIGYVLSGLKMSKDE